MKDHFVVIDTETSGLFDYSKPADAEGQPRMASLAVIFVDGELGIASEREFFIKPEGWTMDPEVAKIHGLTQEVLLEKGGPIADALAYYNSVLDGDLVVVGYNVSYDLKVLRGELRRAGLPDRFETTRSIDVMRPLTDICKIPKKKGAGYKLPKLQEAYTHFFGADAMHQFHGALGDARACANIFRLTYQRGIFKIAAEIRREGV